MNFIQNILKLISINRSKWIIFIFIFIGYLAWLSIPDVFGLINGRNKIKLISTIYSISKDFYSNLVACMFYYLTIETFIEFFKTKNELTYVYREYKKMKMIVFEQLLRIQNEIRYLPKESESIIQEICENPEKAKEYFTQEKLWKILINLDEESLQIITDSMHRFL